MFLLDKLLVGGLGFVLDKVAVATSAELGDDTHLREELLAAQMQVELGEITQQQLEALEDEVLGRLRALRGSREELGAGDVQSVEAELVADDFHQPLEAWTPPAPAAGSGSGRRKAVRRRRGR